MLEIDHQATTDGKLARLKNTIERRLALLDHRASRLEEQNAQQKREIDEMVHRLTD